MYGKLLAFVLRVFNRSKGHTACVFHFIFIYFRDTTLWNGFPGTWPQFVTTHLQETRIRLTTILFATYVEVPIRS